MFEKLENKLKNPLFRYALIAATIALIMTRPLFIIMTNVFTNHDLYIYINVIQAMDSGLVLYKDAVDVKNMGFFFFFFGIYKMYKLFFSDMSYFHTFSNIFLCLLYITTSFFSYNIVYNVYKKHTKAFFYAIFTALSFMFTHMAWYMNQSQFAIIFPLLLTWLIVKKKEKFSYINYFVYGCILALCVAASTPYIVLTLIIPILACRDFVSNHTDNKKLKSRILAYINKKNIFAIITKSLVAFIGFLLVLLPFFMYFYLNDALADWWTINFQHATTYNATHEGRINFFGIHIIESLLGTIITSHTIKSDKYETIIFTVFTYSIWIYLIIIRALKHIKNINKDKQILLIMAILALTSRLLLVRNMSSYNIYYYPFMIFILPIAVELYSKTKNNQSFESFVRTMMIIIASLAIVFPPYIHLMEPIGYNRNIYRVMITNPDKKPTYIATKSIYTFATDWTSLYYNVYDEYKNDKNALENIINKSPEVVFISKHNVDDNFLSVYERAVEDMYIRKDKIDEWKLDVLEPLERSPIKPLINMPPEIRKKFAF